MTRATAQVIGETTTVSSTGAVTVAGGGIYALPNNSGNTTRLRFSAASEIEVGVGYQMFDHVRFTLGYSYLAWTAVVRPGDLIDTRINPNQFPPTTTGGPLLPERQHGSTIFRANMLTAGVEIRY